MAAAAGSRLRAPEGFGALRAGQTEAQAFADLRVVLDDLERRFPGLKATVTSERTKGRPVMPAFEVPRDARIVKTLNASYQAVRGEPQPTALAPPCYYSTDAGHFDRELGMESIVCGPGGRYNTLPDERVDIADYLDMIRIYILTMLDVCELV